LKASPPATSSNGFLLSPRISRTFCADLLRARIEPVDALGRKLDFHALRKTFGHLLARNGNGSSAAKPQKTLQIKANVTI
jgi:hypothetical protein